MSPYVPHSGAQGAVSGLLAVALMELEQSWKFNKHPRLQLFELSVILLFFILLGTLPVVEIFNIITGFILGILLGSVILPYINFGNWGALFRKALLIFAMPLLAAFVVLIFFLFYELQDVREKCGKGCEDIDCVPYTWYLCDNNQ